MALVFGERKKSKNNLFSQGSQREIENLSQLLLSKRRKMEKVHQQANFGVKHHYKSERELMRQDEYREEEEDEEEEELPYEKFNSRQTIRNLDDESDSNNY